MQEQYNSITPAGRVCMVLYIMHVILVLKKTNYGGYIYMYNDMQPHS